MVPSPAFGGFVGCDADALHSTHHLEPRLPASWDFAEIRNVRVGDDLYEITLKRDRNHLLATVRSAQPTVLCLNSQNEACYDRSAATRTISLPLPLVEASLSQPHLPEAASPTTQPLSITDSSQHNHLS